MARVLNERKKLVCIKTSGPIVELGCLTGPIRSARVNIATLMLMIQNGKKVYEINPANPNEMIQLNMVNVTKNNFEKITESAEMKERKMKEENIDIVNASVTHTSFTPALKNEETSTNMKVEEKEETSEGSDDKKDEKKEETTQQPYYSKKSGKSYQNDFKKK